MEWCLGTGRTIDLGRRRVGKAGQGNGGRLRVGQERFDAGLEVGEDLEGAGELLLGPRPVADGEEALAEAVGGACDEG